MWYVQWKGSDWLQGIFYTSILYRVFYPLFLAFGTERLTPVINTSCQPSVAEKSWLSFSKVEVKNLITKWGLNGWGDAIIHRECSEIQKSGNSRNQLWLHWMLTPNNALTGHYSLFLPWLYKQLFTTWRLKTVLFHKVSTISDSGLLPSLSLLWCLVLGNSLKVNVSAVTFFFWAETLINEYWCPGQILEWSLCCGHICMCSWPAQEADSFCKSGGSTGLYLVVASLVPSVQNVGRMNTDE